MPWSRDEGERRHLTVMFCDLVESTAIGEELDPEELREVIGAYQAICAAVVKRFEGRVAQYLGDGVLAYFSFPQAHEDDPERAVRAGLGILDELEAAQPRLQREHGVRVSVRIGIDTGPVVVGAMGAGSLHEALALGHTVNVAARLQEIAEPGTVVISEDTLRLVPGLFVTEDLGFHPLRGIADPVAIHRVSRASGVRSRLDVAAAAGLTPLVGRESDLALLLECWGEARDGRGQVVLVEGEPGIGKSRLVLALRDRLAEERHTWLECRGSPYHQNSALHPVVELLRQGLQLSDEQPVAEKIARVERSLERAGLDRDETLPLFAELLSLELPEGHAPLSLSPEARRRKTLDALGRWLFTLAALQPTLLVVEDLHWTDPSSRELLGTLLEQVSAAPVLLLLTFRPVFEPPWKDRPHLARLTVTPLTPAQTAAMVEGIAKGALPAELVGQVVTKSDGVPLFVEELTKSVLESLRLGNAEPGRGQKLQPSALAIPSTLQDSLMARLDRLGATKEVAQVAAVLGREFPQPLLAAAMAEDPSLEPGLAKLVSAELLYPRGDPPSSYTFKHALIQEAAYQSLLKGTRRAWHARIAQILEESFPALVASEPEGVARHCEEGALVEKAISYYQRAGERATARSASSEAVGHLRKAIELLSTLPESPERDRRELVLQVALGAPLVSSTSWAHAEAESTHARARELCERVPDAPQLFQVIRNLVTFYIGRAEFELASELCARLLRLAESDGESSHLLLAHQHAAIILFYVGQPVAALEHYERAVALYDPAEHASLTPVYGEELGVFTRIWMTWALWVLGHPDRALATSREAIALARESGHAFSLAYALLWGAIVHSMRREPEAIRERSEAALAIAKEQGFSFVQGAARLLRAIGGLMSRLGAPGTEDVIEEYRQSIAQLARTGTVNGRPWILAHLAEAYCAARQYEEAHKVIEVALATSERHWDADLYRLEGEVLLQEGAEGEGERLFRRALGVARSQNAKSFELRAATSLSRLWQKQRKEEDARKLLEPIYGWFTEGFETPDLQEARALLDALS